MFDAKSLPSACGLLLTMYESEAALIRQLLIPLHFGTIFSTAACMHQLVVNHLRVWQLLLLLTNECYAPISILLYIKTFA